MGFKIIKKLILIDELIYIFLVNTTLIRQQQPLQEDFLLDRISNLFLGTRQTMQSTSEFTMTQNTSHNFYKAVTVN